MESIQEREELLEEILIIETIVKDNPCKMPKSVMQSLKNVLHDFVGKHCVEGASKEEVALYFKVDVRTITNWQNKYQDFPIGKKKGKKELSFNWMDVIQWKLKHKDIVNS